VKRVTLHVDNDHHHRTVTIRVSRDQTLTLTPAAAMELADDLTRAAEPLIDLRSLRHAA
jgi:hypothetical protein